MYWSYLCGDCRTRRCCSIEFPKLWPARHSDPDPSSRSADRTKSATDKTESGDSEPEPATRTATTYRQTPTARAGSTGVERTDRCRATVAESRRGMRHASSGDSSHRGDPQGTRRTAAGRGSNKKQTGSVRICNVGFWLRFQDERSKLV